MKNLLTISLSLALLGFCGQNLSAAPKLPGSVTFTKEVMRDKMKGGWAGQTIGCTYGAPTEFKYATYIPDHQPIEWPDHYVKWWFDSSTGLYDDVYMDLTFVEVFDRLGMDAPVDSFARAFADAPYRLWHGNQAARYNILQGIMPPKSGHWLNNLHCDDLDYMIEADYAGLMTPGMPNSASDISDKIGHIMSYGDGWYGGVYVGAMYSLAFVSDDMDFVVSEALKTIPAESRFYQCIADVIRWHKEFPDDWKRTWFECHRKWGEDIGCPRAVFGSSNIDASLNGAYVVIGLLYGQKDFFQTIDISTRCGQDSDCNPATAGGILGTMIGYSNIPEYWVRNLREVEDRNFVYTQTSVNKAADLSLKHALQMIEREGGKVKGDNVTIKCQQPVPVRFEQSFAGYYPVKMLRLQDPLQKVEKVEFEGTGAVFKGVLKCDDPKYVAEIEFYVDGKLHELVKLPALFHDRKQEICWAFELPKGKHTATFKWRNPRADTVLDCADVLVYSDAPHVHEHARLQQEIK